MSQPLATQFPVHRVSALVSGGGSTNPFAAVTKAVGTPPVNYLNTIAGGLIYVPLTFAPALTVAAYTAGATDSFCWLVVTWNSSYIPISATLASGSAWPTGLVYDTTALAIKIPIAYIDPVSGLLVQVRVSNIMLDSAFVPAGGTILYPSTA